MRSGLAQFRSLGWAESLARELRGRRLRRESALESVTYLLVLGVCAGDAASAVPEPERKPPRAKPSSGAYGDHRTGGDELAGLGREPVRTAARSGRTELRAAGLVDDETGLAQSTPGCPGQSRSSLRRCRQFNP